MARIKRDFVEDIFVAAFLLISFVAGMIVMAQMTHVAHNMQKPPKVEAKQ